MPYHEVKDPFQTAQDVLFEQLRKAGAEKQRREREQEHYQSMQDYLSEQVNNYNNGVDPADEEPGYGTEKTNQDVQDSMNEKLADKGIKVDNVDTKHVSDETQDMILANRPTTAGQTDKKFSVSTQPKPTETTGEKNESIQTSMNEKLGDKGIKVGGVNSGAVEGKEVNPVKNVNPPKTIQKRFKDDSGYVTRIVPNKPSATVAQGSETKVKAPSKTPDK